ncbi:FkbM family methyltransferase [Candidatus Gracilibacteria bacterium]|nr:FkbM family methyltransferase [Candidatus Gracilibacteria bacterium]
MRPLLRPGTVFVDVGANIGYYSMLAAHAVCPNGKVIACEPDADNCALLRSSRAHNGFASVYVYELAVAERNGTVTIGMDDSNGMIDRDTAAFSFDVRSACLDELLCAEPQVDVVKIDIEGAEGRALMGMRGLLARCRPTLFVEFTPRLLPQSSGINAEAFLDALRANGYALFVIHRHRTLDTLPQTNAEIMASYAASGSDHLDLLARPV